MYFAIPMFADVVNDVLGRDVSDPSICRAAACQHAACGTCHMSAIVSRFMYDVCIVLMARH
jgi:hypothetical protein